MIRGISLPRAESAASGAFLPADRRRAWSSAGREIWPLGQRWDDVDVKGKKRVGLPAWTQTSVTTSGARVRRGWFGPASEEFSPCIAEGEKDEWAKGLEFGPCEHQWVFSLF